MSINNRACQFSPFAALTGYDENICAASRLTDSRLEFTEDILTELNTAFQRLLQMESDRPEMYITYFKPDKRKSGGAYVTYTGTFRFFNEIEGKLKFTDGTAIDISEIYEIRFCS